MRILALLGNLYDRLGRADDASRHWRLASGVAGVLPVLPVSRALPAADTRGDPTLIDVGRMPQAQVLRDMPAPMAASAADFDGRSEEHTSELQSLMRISYAVFCLKKKTTT